MQLARQKEYLINIVGNKIITNFIEYGIFLLLIKNNCMRKVLFYEVNRNTFKVC